MFNYEQKKFKPKNYIQKNQNKQKLYIESQKFKKLNNPKKNLKTNKKKSLNILPKMSAVNFVNSKAEILKKFQALSLNINAAIGLQEVMKSNLGPKGTLKMYKIIKKQILIFHTKQVGRRCRSNQID